MKMKRILYILILPVLLLGCNNQYKGKLESKIEKHIDKNCTGACTIDLTDITDFSWDKLYTFDESVSLDTIERVLGQKYPYYTDIARRMIFVDADNNIVYHEDVFPYTEGVIEGQIVFVKPESFSYCVFSESKFNVKKIETAETYYYILEQ